MTGFQLHESKEGPGSRLAVVQYMNLKCEMLSERLGLAMVAGTDSRREQTAYRFAKLDLKSCLKRRRWSGRSGTGEVYYTNSSHIPYSVGWTADKVLREGRFHPMISAGAITHLWMGGAQAGPGPPWRPSSGRSSFTRRTPRWPSARVHHLQRLRPGEPWAPDGMRMVRER